MRNTPGANKIDANQPFAGRKVFEMIGDPQNSGNSEKYREMGTIAITRILEAGRGAGPNNPDGYKINSYDQLSGLRVAAFCLAILLTVRVRRLAWVFGSRVLLCRRDRDRAGNAPPWSHGSATRIGRRRRSRGCWRPAVVGRRSRRLRD